MTVLANRRHSTIARVVTADGDLRSASAGQAVTLTLTEEVDVSRGDVIVHDASVMQARKSMTARLLWMVDGPLRPGQGFIIKLGTVEANADVARLRHAVDIHSFQDRPVDSLAMNAIGVVELTFDKAIAATVYGRDRELGSFILIDRMTNQTVALGTVEEDRPRQANDNARVRAVRRLVGPAGSPERWRFWSSVGRKVIEAVVLFLVVAVLARNFCLALTVTVADLLLRPVADRIAAWGWRHLFAGHRPSYPSGHAD